MGSTAKAYFARLSNVDPLPKFAFARTTPTLIVLILERVRSRSPFDKIESLATCGVARSVVPSSTVPSLLPKIEVNAVVRSDASSGVNVPSGTLRSPAVNALTPAVTDDTIATSPKTAQPAGWTVLLIAFLQVLIDSPTLTT